MSNKIAEPVTLPTNDKEWYEMQMKKVVEALDRVEPQTKQLIFNMSMQMSELEIIQQFNQSIIDLFTELHATTKRLGQEREYKIAGYKALFDNAIKINSKLAIDKFTLVILEFAPEIYAEDEENFLKMTIPDANVKVGGEFGIIRSEMFKKLWFQFNAAEKDKVKNNIMLSTTFAHVFLYKTLLSKKQSDKKKVDK